MKAFLGSIVAYLSFDFLRAATITAADSVITAGGSHVAVVNIDSSGGALIAAADASASVVA